MAEANAAPTAPAIDYQELASRLRSIVSQTLPPEATVIVVNKGDDRLLELDGRKGWHFPQTARGTYVGYHPADSRAAIAHLEILRVCGGEYLLFPNVAFWWLDYYRDFRSHLDARPTGLGPRWSGLAAHRRSCIQTHAGR